MDLDIYITMFCKTPVSRGNLFLPLPDVLVPLASSRIMDFGQDHVIHTPQDLYMSTLLAITHPLRICFASELGLHLPVSC